MTQDYIAFISIFLTDVIIGTTTDTTVMALGGLQYVKNGKILTVLQSGHWRMDIMTNYPLIELMLIWDILRIIVDGLMHTNNRIIEVITSYTHITLRHTQ